MERTDLFELELPDCPGVYLFIKGKGRAKKILYIGKATSLRDRVRSYFDSELISTRGPRIVDMVTHADTVQHETTPTVLEALVREAALIREHNPPANSMGKDDKTFLYAVVTNELVPRVLMIRAKELDFEKNETLSAPFFSFSHAYGPFTSGYQLREALRLIRKIFPFFDTDKPISIDENKIARMATGVNKHHTAKVEFNRQIGHYPRYMDAKAYAKSIRNVRLFLSGRVQTLRATLTKEMKVAAVAERFEDAALIRGQLFALDHVQDVSLIREDRGGEPSGPRIEAYDTAHISGTNAIGVMTVIENSTPIKSDYRMFRIRGEGDGVTKTGKSKTAPKANVRQNNDIASLKEILSRRLGHHEWPLPKAFVIDGGKTHKKAAESVLELVGIHIPVVAVVKDEKHRPREVIGGRRAGITDADAVLANSEAHRFSLARHRYARKMQMRRSVDNT
jgi:excinuclease UvrABC nuclease subunit